MVSDYGIQADPKKVTAVTEFPKPTDLKSLRAFLWLTLYYRRFVPCFSSVVSPLYALTCKDTAFEWLSDCETAFMQLKTLLTQSPMLAYPCFSEEFLLKRDASGVGLGAVLSQLQPDETIQPITFAGRTLQSHERNYGISELEALAVVWAVKHYRHYLYGHHCTVFTDHEALKSLLNTPQPSGKLARWRMALQEYRPRKMNGRADALSRYPISLLASDCTDTSTLTLVTNMDGAGSDAESGDGRTLSERQREDPDLAAIIDYQQKGVLPEEETAARELVLGASLYNLVDGVLYHVRVEKDVTPDSTDCKPSPAISGST